MSASDFVPVFPIDLTREPPGLGYSALLKPDRRIFMTITGRAFPDENGHGYRFVYRLRPQTKPLRIVAPETGLDGAKR